VVNFTPLLPYPRGKYHHWTGFFVCRTACLDYVEKLTFLTLPGFESDPSVVQTVASRYTNCGTWTCSISQRLLCLRRVLYYFPRTFQLRTRIRFWEWIYVIDYSVFLRPCAGKGMDGCPIQRTQPNLRQKKKTQWPKSSSELYRPSDRRLSAQLVPTFADRGCHVVSVTDPYGRILGFLDRGRKYIPSARKSQSRVRNKPH
jgi:hypothetical protein